MNDNNQFDNKELMKILSLLKQENEHLRTENELLQKQIELYNIRINNLLKRNDINIGLNDIVNKLFVPSHTSEEHELSEDDTENINIMHYDLKEIAVPERDDIEITRDDTDITRNDIIKQIKNTLTGNNSSCNDLKSHMIQNKDSTSENNEPNTEIEIPDSGNIDTLNENNDTVTENNNNVIETNCIETQNNNASAIDKMSEDSENESEIHSGSDESENRKNVMPEFDTENISGKFKTFSAGKLTEDIINETVRDDNIHRVNDNANIPNEYDKKDNIIKTSNNDNVSFAGQSAEVNSFMKKLNENLKGTLRKKYPKKMMKRWVNELVYLYNNKRVNSEDFQTAINISRPTLMRDIKMIKNKGWLEYKGTPKIGFYKMTEEGIEFLKKVFSSTDY